MKKSKALFSNPNVINQVRSGYSKAYGVELNLLKNVGKKRLLNGFFIALCKI